MAKKDKVPAKRLKGFRDYGPSQALARKRIIDCLWQTAIRAGFQPIATPALEYSETLLGSGGQETDKEVYRFVDHGEREVALRFDLTVPFARYVAENQGTLVLPFKKVQIGEVWRGEKPQKGRYREFCQADLDIVGADSLAADVEVIACLAKTLARLVPGTFTMALGHRVLLSALIRKALPEVAAEQETAALIAIDKLAKIGRDKVAELLAELPGATAAGAERLLEELLRKGPDGGSDMAAIGEFLGGDDVISAEVARFRETLSILETLLQGGAARVVGDLSIARGLGYYTGVVFETTIDDLPGFGSISSGGRYNGLVSRFSTTEIPGVGGSIGVDRLLGALEELGQLKDTAGGDVFIAVATEDARAYAFQLAERLREQGIVTDIGLKPGKLGNQFKFADRAGFRHVITVGSDEVQSETYSLKTLATGHEEKGLPVAGVIEKLSAR